MTHLEEQSAETESIRDAKYTLQKQEFRWNGQVSITVTLASAIGILVLVSVGVVLGVGIWLAQKNTFALLSENANQGVSAAVDRIRQYLQPAEHQAKFLVERIVRGDVDPTNHAQFGPMLTGALAAAPQIEAVLFIDPSLQSFSAAAASRERWPTWPAASVHSRPSNAHRSMRRACTW